MIKKEEVIGMMSSIAILNNKSDDDRWGILFDKVVDNGKELNNAFVVGRAQETQMTAVIVNVSDFENNDFDSKKPFFNFDQNKFSSNTIGYSVDYLAKFCSSQVFTQGIRVPIGNLINFIDKALPDYSNIRRSRIIISTDDGYLEEGEFLCKFNEDKIFQHPKQDRILVVDKYSKIDSSLVIPNKTYVCRIINESDNAYFVNVIKPYFKGIVFAIKETTAGYFPESEKELYNFSLYPENNVLRVPFMLEGKYSFEPIHIDCSLLMDCLKLYVGFKWIDIVINEQSNLKPIMLTGLKENEDYPLINCFIAPLDTSVRGGRR